MPEDAAPDGQAGPGPGEQSAAGGAGLLPVRQPEPAHRELVLIGRPGAPTPRDFLRAGGGALLAVLPIVLGPLAVVALHAGLAAIPVAAAALAAFAVLFTAGFARYLMMPHNGWLEGSVLTVEAPRRTRHCDLASAAVIQLLSRSSPAGMPVLAVRQHPRGPQLRLVLRGPDLRPLPAAHLRLLAQAIGTRRGPDDKEITGVVRQLRELAERQEPPTAPPAAASYWSHRTDPEGKGTGASPPAG